jgi:hypothetical protein
MDSILPFFIIYLQDDGHFDPYQSRAPRLQPAVAKRAGRLDRSIPVQVQTECCVETDRGFALQMLVN